MVLVITGENDYERTAELTRLTDDFRAKNDDLAIEKIEAGDIEFGRLLESVSSLPFLSSRRMIVIYDPSANGDLTERAEELLDAVADTTDLIIVEPKFDKRSSLYKILKERADFKEFNSIDEKSLPSWLVGEAKKLGGNISQADANYLVQRIGANQLTAFHELEKLIIYDPDVSRAAIDMLTEKLPQSTVFNLLDAAFSGDKKKALAIYEDQRSQMVEPQTILGMMAWQVHVLAVVKFNEKSGADGIAKQAKLNPFVVRKTLIVAKRLTAKQVKSLVSRVLKLDVRLKSENIDADEAVRQLIISL